MPKSTASNSPSFIPALEARTSAAGKSDAEILAVFQDSAKKVVTPSSAYSNLFQKFKKSGAFSARAGSVQFVRFGGKKSFESVAFVGLGAVVDLKEDAIRSAGANAWTKLVAERCKTLGVQVDSFHAPKGSELTPLRAARLFAEGMILCAYQFTKHKTKPDEYHGLSKISFITRDANLKKQLDLELAEVEAVGESVNLTRDWSNEPSNIGTPEYYAAEAKKLAAAHGLTCRVLNEKDLAKEKMTLLLAVGQGSTRESRVVVVEYNPKGIKDAKNVVLVGKGVTFDSGGISLKPGLKMEDMKHDMTGAATVMGAVLLAAKWKVNNRVIGVMAFVENMPDGGALAPGNVIKTRAGKTVEVNNTDAEGRLILADALDFAQDLKPDAMIDVATLTGAVLVALGKYCSGMMGNDDGVLSDLTRAGDVNGERVWQLPLYDEYFDDLRSTSADMRNVGNNPLGGAIRGGIFLKQFIRKGTRWAHLDIAATAYEMGHLSYYPKAGASGAHVRTLAQFAKDFK